MVFTVFFVSSFLYDFNPAGFFLVKTPNKREEPLPLKKFWSNIKDTFKNNGKWLYAIFLIGAILMFVLFGILFYLSDVLEKIYDIKDVKKGFS